MGRIVVKAGQLIDGSGGQPQHNVAVVIEGELIAAIQPIGQPLPADAEVIDATGQTVIPGLIDAHVHLCFSGSPLPLTEILAERDEQVLLRAVGNAQSALANGVTTLRDCGGRNYLTLAVRDAIAMGLVTGPNVVVAGPPITTTAGHLYFCGLEAEGPVEVRRAVRQLVKRGVDFVKVMVTGGNMTPGTNRWALQYSPEELAAIAADAHRLGRRVAGHMMWTPAIRAAVEAGFDTLEHCAWSNPEAPNGTEYDSDVAAIMAERQVFVGVTLGGEDRRLARLVQSGAGLGPELRMQAEQRAEIQHRMRSQGVPLACHSDGGTRYCSFADFAQSIAALVRVYGWRPMDAIVAATNTAARAIACTSVTGQLGSGQPADLLVVDGDPLRQIEALSRVERVVQRGRTVAEYGRLVV